MKKRKQNVDAGIVHGYYVMKWGGGRYTSVSYHYTKAQAQAEVNRIMKVGSWSGMPPKIELAVHVERKKNPISDKQALTLTKKVIAAGKKLFLHGILSST